MDVMMTFSQHLIFNTLFHVFSSFFLFLLFYDYATSARDRLSPSVLDTDLEPLNQGMYRVQHGAALNLEVDTERSSCLY